MTATVDYASFYELQVRPRRARQLRRLLAHALLAGLLLVRPRLALQIWRERAL